jgi:hypothetical protein
MLYAITLTLAGAMDPARTATTVASDPYVHVRRRSLPHPKKWITYHWVQSASVPRDSAGYNTQYVMAEGGTNPLSHIGTVMSSLWDETHSPAGLALITCNTTHCKPCGLHHHTMYDRCIPLVVLGGKPPAIAIAPLPLVIAPSLTGAMYAIASTSVPQVQHHHPIV